MTTCRGCSHPRHMHQSGGVCKAVTISGPPSDTGKPMVDYYDHGGREELLCWCPRYSGVNGNEKA